MGGVSPSACCLEADIQIAHLPNSPTPPSHDFSAAHARRSKAFLQPEARSLIRSTVKVICTACWIAPRKIPNLKRENESKSMELDQEDRSKRPSVKPKGVVREGSSQDEKINEQGTVALKKNEGKVIDSELNSRKTEG